jgi:hypothetical protein
LGHFLRVANAVDAQSGRKHDRCGDDRSGQRPPPGLIDTGDKKKALLSQGFIVSEKIHAAGD